MKVFKDYFTDKTVFSDEYNFELVDDAYYVVTGALEVHTDGITGLVSNLISSNKLEEIVSINSLEDFKPSIKNYAKKLLQRVMANSPERADVLKRAIPATISHIIKNYTQYSFYATEEDGFEIDGIIIPHQIIRNDPEQEKAGDLCRIIVFKDGVYEEKI